MLKCLLLLLLPAGASGWRDCGVPGEGWGGSGIQAGAGGTGTILWGPHHWRQKVCMNNPCEVMKGGLLVACSSCPHPPISKCGYDGLDVWHARLVHGQVPVVVYMGKTRDDQCGVWPWWSSAGANGTAVGKYINTSQYGWANLPTNMFTTSHCIPCGLNSAVLQAWLPEGWLQACAALA